MISRFNSWLAVKVTGAVGTMWMAYAFCALALVSLPAAIATGDKIIIVAWIAQTFLQLVLLPIIIVGQRVLADQHDELHGKVDGLVDSHGEVHAKLDAVLAGRTHRDGRGE